MAARTRVRVSSEMVRLPLRTYETVLGDTPACFATSPIVAMAHTVAGRAPGVPLRRPGLSITTVGAPGRAGFLAVRAPCPFYERSTGEPNRYRTAPRCRWPGVGLLSRSVSAVRPEPVPRDVEALEELVTALAGATDEESTWRITVQSLVRSYEYIFGAVWRPTGPGGALEMTYATGAIADQLRAGPSGLVSQAYQSRKPIYAGDLAEVRDCPRAAEALRAGAAAASVVPVVRDGRVVAVFEYYKPYHLHVDEPRTQKWSAILRIAELARSQVLAAAELRQVADARAAVTEVVTALGHALDTPGAIRAALDTVRSSFGWAYGSYWEVEDRDTGPVLVFRHESGSA